MNGSDIATSNKFEITGATLKWIAIITMLIDHIGAAILEPYAEMQMMTSDASSLWTLDMLLRGIGRLAFPIFIFLMVEGFYYTHDRKKYFFRMVLFSLISEIPFDMAFQRTLTMDGSHKIPLLDFSSQNVFFTLTLGFLAIWLTDGILSFAERKNNEAMMAASEISAKSTGDENFGVLFVLLQIIGIFAVVVCCCFAAEYMETDYDSIGVLAMFACYLGKKKGGNYVLMMLAPVVILIFMSSSEATALVNLIFVFFYHGKKGRNINKWFFYFFYPVHLLILGIIQYLII